MKLNSTKSFSIIKALVGCGLLLGVICWFAFYANAEDAKVQRVSVITNIAETNARTRIKEILGKLFGGPGSVELIRKSATENPPGCTCIELLFPFALPVDAGQSPLKQNAKESTANAVGNTISRSGDVIAQATNNGGLPGVFAGDMSRGAARVTSEAAKAAIAGSGKKWPDRWELNVAISSGCMQNKPLTTDDAISLAFRLGEDNGMVVVEQVGLQQQRHLSKLKHKIDIFRGRRNQQVSDGQIAMAILEVLSAYAQGNLIDEKGNLIPLPAGDPLKAIYTRVMLSRPVVADTGQKSDAALISNTTAKAAPTPSGPLPSTQVETVVGQQTTGAKPQILPTPAIQNPLPLNPDGLPEFVQKWAAAGPILQNLKTGDTGESVEYFLGLAVKGKWMTWPAPKEDKDGKIIIWRRWYGKNSPTIVSAMKRALLEQDPTTATLFGIIAVDDVFDTRFRAYLNNYLSKYPQFKVKVQDALPPGYTRP